jgi:uncharacterized membrane protein
MQTEKEPSSMGSTLGLGLLFGLIGAGLAEDFRGFLAGSLIGVLLAQVLHLRRRVSQLHEGMIAQRDAIAGWQKRKPDAEPSHEAIEPKVIEPEVIEPEVIEPEPEAFEIPEPAPVVAKISAADFEPVRTPRAPVAPTLVDRALDWIKSGNPLARIGIVILFLGAAFLAKYAADHSLFPIELRFMLLAAGALTLLVIGWRLRETRAVYARLLQGGGIAGLYLTVFAATRLYHLLPLGFAFGLMVVVALAAAVLAVAQDALALAVIGTAGGFLAPILVSTGSGNHVALFSYYAILNLGVFAVAWFRTWRVMNLLGFLFTFSITGLWRANSYEAADLWSADGFLILFFLMYVAVSILNSIRQDSFLLDPRPRRDDDAAASRSFKGYISGSLVFGLPVVAFTLHATLVSDIEYALAWSALTVGAFYLTVAFTLYRTARENFRLLIEAFAALGIIFASLAIPLAFDTRTTAAMWAVEGAGLLWLGIRQSRKLPRIFSTLLQIAGGMGFLGNVYAMQADRPFANGVFIGAFTLGVTGWLSSYWFDRNRPHRASYEIGWQIAFALWGTAWWLFAFLNEVDRHAHGFELGAALGVGALTAVLLHALGRRAAWSIAKTIARYLPALTAFTGLVSASFLSHPFKEWAAVGWLLVVIAHYASLYHADRDDDRATVIAWLHGGALCVTALVLAWEARWQVAQHTTGVWPALMWGLVPAALVAFVARRRPFPSWPIARHIDAYRTGATPLIVALAGWIIVVNCTSDGDPAWLPYVPLLNPLDVSVVVSFLAGALWWTSLEAGARARFAESFRLLIAVVAGIVFLWLNAALIRSLHHNFGAPITLYGITHSTLVQASVSIFWGLLGFTAMTLAARKQWRHVWIVGVSLMVVVVAKLTFVDLWSVGTLARIASFITVGVLLLVTGYLAPLPPKAREAVK